MIHLNLEDCKISIKKYNSFFQRCFTRLVVERTQINLVIYYDQKQEEIVQCL